MKDIVINARKQAAIKNPINNEYFEVDIFIPSLQLGFEFQVLELHSFALLMLVQG